MTPQTGVRRAPVQRDRANPSAGTVPWETHEAAWDGYAAVGHGGPFGQDAETIAKRGGLRPCRDLRSDPSGPGGLGASVKPRTVAEFIRDERL